VEAGDGPGAAAGLIDTIHRRSPGTRIVLVGDFGHPNWLQQPLTRVDGFVQDSALPEALVASLDLVMLGAAVLPRSLTCLLIEQARASSAPSPVRHLGFDDQRFVNLTVRRLSALERDVLRHLRKGATNKAIAHQLGLSLSAVNVAMKGILRRIGVQNRTQAALWALENLQNERALDRHIQQAKAA